MVALRQIQAWETGAATALGMLSLGTILTLYFDLRKVKEAPDGSL
jgi:hypothetical protein